MAKYHIKTDGMPGPCTASSRACPRGGAEDHFDTLVEAAQAIEDRNRAVAVPKAVSKTSLITRMKGLVEDLEIPSDLKNEFDSTPDKYQDLVKNLLEKKDTAEASDHLPWKQKSPLTRQVSSAEYALVKALAEGSIEYLEFPSQLRDALWSKAWADGHASGYHEVMGHYNELADFAGTAFECGREAGEKNRDSD